MLIKTEMPFDAHITAAPTCLLCRRALVSNIIIDYVATDSAGNTATSTRTIFIAAPSIVPTNDASSTATTTTP